VKLFDIVLTMHGLMSFDEEKKNSFEVALGTRTMTGFEASRLGLPGRLLGRGGGHRHPHSSFAQILRKSSSPGVP
jgi:hypothetical protein